MLKDSTQFFLVFIFPKGKLNPSSLLSTRGIAQSSKPQPFAECAGELYGCVACFTDLLLKHAKRFALRRGLAEARWRKKGHREQCYIISVLPCDPPRTVDRLRPTSTARIAKINYFFHNLASSRGVAYCSDRHSGRRMRIFSLCLCLGVYNRSCATRDSPWMHRLRNAGR